MTNKIYRMPGTNAMYQLQFHRYNVDEYFFYLVPIIAVRGDPGAITVILGWFWWTITWTTDKKLVEKR